MPLYNETGEPLPLIQLTGEELGKAVYLGSLVFPQDENIIFTLSPNDFRAWIHQLNPREALILASTHGISTRIQKQLDWKRWTIITDWLWRLWH